MESLCNACAAAENTYMTKPIDEVNSICNLTYFGFLYITKNIIASNMSLVK